MVARPSAAAAVVARPGTVSAAADAAGYINMPTSEKGGDKLFGYWIRTKAALLYTLPKINCCVWGGGGCFSG